jgi:hypothetical protein
MRAILVAYIMRFIALVWAKALGMVLLALCKARCIIQCNSNETVKHSMGRVATDICF